MGDDITIGVTEIVNNIEVTAQPNDQIVEIDVVDNSDEVTLNITPTVIEININKGSSFARWGDILGNLPDQEDLQNVLNLKADLVGGLVPASQLPSYVDDIIEVANYAALPTTGEVGKIYVTLDNNKIFRWSGSVYIEIAANTGVWGAITGTLSSQTDLQTALDTKALKTITITPSAPLSGGGDLSANRTISISQSNATTDGYLSSIDWNTFNDKQYALNGTGFVKISGTTISYDNSTYVPTSRTLTINGTAYDLSTNRSWTIPTHDAVTIGTPANGLSLSGQVLSLSVAHSLNTGALSSTDWTTFNNKIGGSGTINYIPKFTASGAIGNSNIFDNGAYVDILTGAFIAGNLNVKGVVSSGVPADTLSILSGSGAIFVKNSASNTAYAFQLNTSSGLDLWSTNSGGTSTRRMTLDSSGNLGIGTTSPNYSSSGRTVVDINGTSQSMLALSVGGVGKSFLFYTGTDLLVSNESNGAIKFNTNGSEKAIITSGGNVGIGTTSPTQLLQVVGGIGEFVRTGGDSQVRVTASGVANTVFGFNNSGSTSVFGVPNNTSYLFNGQAYPLVFGTDSTERMRITSGGNVELKNSDSRLYGGDNVGRFIIGNPSVTTYLAMYGSSHASFPHLAQFVVNNSAVLNMTSGGNVGIGITSPSEKLDVNGNIKSSGSIIIGSGGSTSPGSIFSNANFGFWFKSTQSSPGVAHYQFGDYSGNPLMIINPSGNVGIGTTSPGSKLTVDGGSIRLLSGNDLAFNRPDNGAASNILMNSSNQLVFTSPSGAVFSGTVTATAFIPVSDIRLKDLTDYNYDIESIKPITYTWKDSEDKRKKIGYSAQQIQEVLPEVVNTDDKGMLSVDYNQIFVAKIDMLQNMIQELKAEIEILKTK